MTCPTALTFCDMHDRPAMLALARHLVAEKPSMLAMPGKAGQVARQAQRVLNFDMAKATPQRTWADAQPAHPAIYRALQIDASDPAAFYACLPFRLAKIDGAHVIVTAIYPQRVDAPDWRHIDIDRVVVWNPLSGALSVLGDLGAQIIAPAHYGDAVTVYGDARACFRAWAEARAVFYQRRIDAVADKWAHPTPEPIDGGFPGILAIGDPKAIRWPVRDLPSVINCVGIDRQTVNAGIFRAAALPRVVDANKIREAA